MLAVQDVLDDVVLRADRGGLRRCAMPFERGEDLERLVVLAFADEQTGGVWEEGAQGIDAEGEEELEGEGKAPGDVARGEGEGEGEPVADGEAGDAVCCLRSACVYILIPKSFGEGTYPSG